MLLLDRYRVLGCGAPGRSAGGNFRQAEIQNLRVPARGHKNVGGLDVAMHDSLGMRSIERLGNLDAQRQQGLVIQSTPGHPVFQRRAFEKLHRDKRVPLVPADFVNSADVGMVQRRSRPSLPPEALQSLGILRQLIGKKFQRDEAAKLGIFGLVHHPHTTAAQLFENVVTGDCLTDHGVGSC